MLAFPTFQCTFFLAFLQHFCTQHLCLKILLLLKNEKILLLNFLSLNIKNLALYILRFKLQAHYFKIVPENLVIIT